MTTTQFNPDLRPLDHSKLQHSMHQSLDHLLNSDLPKSNITTPHNHITQPHERQALPLSASFTSIPSQFGPEITLPSPKSPQNDQTQASKLDISKRTGRYPRELKLMHSSTPKSTKSSQPVPNSPRKIRKKRKFRLIPTFKQLENGRFVGRTAEINEIRRLLLESVPINPLNSPDSANFHPNLTPNVTNSTLENFNKLSLVSLSGQSGVGKTSLAYVYLMAFESSYKNVFWLNSNSILSDARDILLYHLSNVYEVQAIKAETSAEIIKYRFLHFLTTLPTDWLLVIDDFTDTNVNIQEWIPQKLQRLKVNQLHKVRAGHVLLTTNMTTVQVQRSFSGFVCKPSNLSIGGLKPHFASTLLTSLLGTDTATPLGASDAPAVPGVPQLVAELEFECLPLTLMGNFLRISNLSVQSGLRKFKEMKSKLTFQRREKLLQIFQNMKMKSGKKSTSSPLHRNKKLKNIFGKKKFIKNSVLSLKGLISEREVNLNNIDDLNLLEIELLLRKFKLIKYFQCIILNNKIYNLNLLINSIQNMQNLNQFCRNLTFIDYKRSKKTYSFDSRDYEKFQSLQRYIKQTRTQQNVDALMLLWLDLLSFRTVANVSKAPIGSDGGSVLEIIRQCSWLGEARIPLFLFPELLGTSSASTEASGSSVSSSCDNSSTSFNSNALSSFNLTAGSGGSSSNTSNGSTSKHNASSRFNSSELEYLNSTSDGILNFLVDCSILKLEKTGFFSCNKLIQTSIRNTETQTEQSFSSVLKLVSKIHRLVFEVNFEDIVGESLSLLRLNPELISNDYNLLDVQYGLQHLTDSELLKYFTHDFSLKLSLLPHLENLRLKCFKELFSNQNLVNKYHSSFLLSQDKLGIKATSTRHFQKYLQFEKLEKLERDGKDSKDLKDFKVAFNASRVSLFPDFERRHLDLVKADLLFNEGLLILNIPFRKTRLLDAFTCFKTAYNTYTQTLSVHKHLKYLKHKDLLLAKSCFFMGSCMLELNNLPQALQLLELSLDHFQDFHGEFTNHVDLARNLSFIAKVYHSAAKSKSTSHNFHNSDNHPFSQTSVNTQRHFQHFQAKEKWSRKVDNDPVRFNSLKFVSDRSNLLSEAVKFHQLALQMYQDLMGPFPLNVNFCRALMLRGKTFILSGDFEAAERDLKIVFESFEKLAKKNVVYNKQLGIVSLNLANLYCVLDSNEKFLFYLNKAMQVYSQFSLFEMKILNIKHSKSKNSQNSQKLHGNYERRRQQVTLGSNIVPGVSGGHEHERFELIEEKLKNLTPHCLVSEALVMTGEILMENGVEECEEKAMVLWQTAVVKYREIFGTFEHPRITAVIKLLDSLATS